MATYLNIEIYTKRVLHGKVADMMEGRGGRTRVADKAIDLAGVQVAGLNDRVFGGSRQRLEEWAWTKFSSCGTIQTWHVHETRIEHMPMIQIGFDTIDAASRAKAFDGLEYPDGQLTGRGRLVVTDRIYGSWRVIPAASLGWELQHLSSTGHAAVNAPSRFAHLTVQPDLSLRKAMLRTDIQYFHPSLNPNPNSATQSSATAPNPIPGGLAPISVNPAPTHPFPSVQSPPYYRRVVDRPVKFVAHGRYWRGSWHEWPQPADCQSVAKRLRTPPTQSTDANAVSEQFLELAKLRYDTETQAHVKKYGGEANPWITSRSPPSGLRRIFAQTPKLTLERGGILNAVESGDIASVSEAPSTLLALDRRIKQIERNNNRRRAKKETNNAWWGVGYESDGDGGDVEWENEPWMS